MDEISFELKKIMKIFILNQLNLHIGMSLEFRCFTNISWKYRFKKTRMLPQKGINYIVLWPSSEYPGFLSRTTDSQWSLFFLKSRTLGLGQTNYADKFWGIWGICGQTVSTHFGKVPCPCFPLFNHYFFKKLSLYIY